MGRKKESPSDLTSVVEKLNKTYGSGSVFKMKEDATPDNYETIPSGSLGLDYKVLGIGGFAKGRLYELMGWESSGKSTICGHIVANCQRRGKTALYVDGEHAVDRDYFEALGVDMERLLMAQPSSGEEGFNIACDVIKTGEVDLVIIDSDNSLIPLSIVEGDVGDSSIGKKARLNSNAYPKLKSLLAEFKVCVIVISQYREKIGVMFGDPKTTQGGHALKYYADCRIEISKSLNKEESIVVSNKTKIKCTKNKMYPPYRDCTFDIVFGKGIDTNSEFIELLVEYDIIREGRIYYENSPDYPDNVFKIKKEDFIDNLKTDEDFAEFLMGEVKKKLTGRS